MKKYKLKQWYPSLGIHAVDGIIIECEEWDNVYVFGELSIPKHEVENNPDFWELVEEKELLFTTEEGVGIADPRTAIVLVNHDFTIDYKPAADCNINTIVATTRLFFHEENAVEYILWNKPLLTLHDIDKELELYTSDFDKLIKLAKERI